MNILEKVYHLPKNIVLNGQVFLTQQVRLREKDGKVEIRYVNENNSVFLRAVRSSEDAAFWEMKSLLESVTYREITFDEKEVNPSF